MQSLVFCSPLDRTQVNYENHVTAGLLACVLVMGNSCSPKTETTQYELAEDIEHSSEEVVDSPSSGSQTPPTPEILPDLTITDIKVNPKPTIRADGVKYLHRRMTYSFQVEVTNIGKGATR